MGLHIGMFSAEKLLDPVDGFVELGDIRPLLAIGEDLVRVGHDELSEFLRLGQGYVDVLPVE